MNLETIHSVEINSLQPVHIFMTGIIRLQQSSFTMLTEMTLDRSKVAVTEKKTKTDLGTVIV